MEYSQLFAERIGGARFGQSGALYKFEKIKRAKAEARAARPGVELLDFGVGEPDRMAPLPVREALKRAVDDPGNRGYADNGIPAFQRAAAEYLRAFFGVCGMDPEREIVHSIGSKSALAILPLAFVNPGDAVLVTTPGYPVLATHSGHLGAEVVPVPLRRGNRFLPDLQAIGDDVLDRAKLFYVNYPNNPTGAAAPPAFWDELIARAARHRFLIVQDAAYATLAYGPRHSILGRPGGKEHALELHSMSKSYNMTGWRLGFVAGAAPAVRAFAEVKDHCDSGQFKAIQVAACAGIADTALSEAIRERYRVRLEKMTRTLRRAGFDAEMPGGTFFLYVPAPAGARGTRFPDAESASQFLIREASISTVPWDDAGAFLRFSATFESAGDEDDDRVLAELERRLAALGLEFGPPPPARSP